MIDVEPMLEDAFARLYPIPSPEPAWDAVLTAAQLRQARRQPRLALAITIVMAAIAAVLLATPLGAALARTLWSFPAWVSGEPGKPASSSAQRAFARENARSWSAFPADTKLRQLIQTRQDGVEYTLYGFRSGDELCLRLIVDGATSGRELSCAPLSDLRSRPAPALAVQVDDGFGTVPGKHVQIGIDTYNVARAGASFGIVTDAVKTVTLRSDDRTRQAIVANDAFLSVVNEPRPGVRVRAITAATASGHTYRVAFATAPFDTLGSVSAPVGKLHGPAHVQRVVRTGTVSWLIRHQSDGKPLPPGFPSALPGATRHLVYGRLLQPDPESPLRVAITLYQVRKARSYTLMKPGMELCADLVDQRATGGGCDPLGDAFKQWPFMMGIFIGRGGDQYSVLSGVASDDVASLRVYFGDGGIAPVPLRDNAFAILVSRARFPLRLVAYDHAGRVIGVQSTPAEGATKRWQIPNPRIPWKPLLRIRDANGKPATLWTKPSLADTTCSQLRSAQSGGGGCPPPGWQGPPLQLGRDGTVISGRTRSDIVRVEIHYKHGPAQTVTPTRGFVLAPVRRTSTIVEIDGYNSHGRRVGQFKPER